MEKLRTWLREHKKAIAAFAAAALLWFQMMGYPTGGLTVDNVTRGVELLAGPEVTRRQVISVPVVVAVTSTAPTTAATR